MLSRPEQTGVFQEDEEAKRPAGTCLPAGFHEFPARPNPAVQPSSGTPATNCIQEELGQRQEAAFSRLKTALLKVPVVHQPDMDKAFHVSTDASQHRVGAVLYQVVNGEKKYVSFTSKALKKGQQNYSATKRELCRQQNPSSFYFWDSYLQITIQKSICESHNFLNNPIIKS